jgi:hypothetical protein
MKVFKYKREDDYFYGVRQNDFEIKGIKNKLEDIRNDNEYDIQGSLLSHEMFIYKLTKPALNINHLKVIQDIKNQIFQVFDKFDKFDLNIYINRSFEPEAKVTSNQSIIKSEKELIIILSQHFLNDLTYDEQLSVISHEVAHYYYNHTSVPFNEIIEKYEYDALTSDKEFLELKIFLQDLKKWSICKEISADLFALQVTKSYKATALALIKFSTGIISEAEDVLRNLEDNFKSLKKNKVKDILKEHPDTLLRVMILKSVFDFVNINGYKNNDKVQNIIDDQIEYIYPEILFHKIDINILYTYELGLLVGAADGEIDKREIMFLTQITYMRKTNEEIKKDCDNINNIISEGCEDPSDKEERKIVAKKYIMNKIPEIHKSLKNEDIHVASVIRNLLSLAKSDGIIDADELETIYQFAKHERYKYSKRDIIQQMFNLSK